MGKKNKTLMSEYFNPKSAKDFVLGLSTEDKQDLMVYNAFAIKSMQLNIKDKSVNVIPVRGEIWTLDFGVNIGKEIDYIRPAIVVSYDSFNANSGLVTVIPISSATECKYYTQFIIDKTCLKSADDSIIGVAKAEQITTKSKARLGEKIGSLNEKGIILLKNALSAHLLLGSISEDINEISNEVLPNQMCIDIDKCI